MEETETVDQSWTYQREGAATSAGAVPGLLALFSGTEAMQLGIPLRESRVLGRGDIGGVPLDDPRMSRRHAEVMFDGARWHIHDLGSRNGTFLDGEPVEGRVVTNKARVLRVGGTLFGLLSDLRPYQRSVMEGQEGMVLGARMQRQWEQIALAARTGDMLHITGESGSGKEAAARHFHRSSTRGQGPFVAVNCASIPPLLAERLLFGARKGAYSGADADAEGYVQAAQGGTLFLDEIAELDLSVQAKLLRVVESKEVLALGATRPRKVEFGLCSATNQDLRGRVATGKFRADLFFRIGRPAVALPPLRDRIEDIPWIMQGQLRKLGSLGLHPSLVEQALVRPWPGNVRELIVELRDAATAAMARKSPRVEACDLRPDAGTSFTPETLPARPAPAVSGGEDPVLTALRRERGNVSRAARALGWHRTQLRRWLTKHNIDPRQLGADDSRHDGADSPLEND
ncbi:MAG: sigma 54-interacting transcriptional regulator [Myxococcota bacterium]